MTENKENPAPAANVAPAIEVRDLSIGYGSRVVLENLNFRIEPGQIVTILGGSGCGKAPCSSTSSVSISRFAATSSSTGAAS